jgi:dynein heavy chain
MKRIFEMVGSLKFNSFEEEDIKNIADPLSVATINLFNQISEHYKPNPSCSHYVFNMRDISKVF